MGVGRAGVGHWACWARAAGGRERAWRAERSERARQGAAGVGARSAGRGRAGRWARAHGALGVGARGARPGRGLGAWAGQDCALGAPDLIFKPVFDSVFFLSQ